MFKNQGWHNIKGFQRDVENCISRSLPSLISKIVTRIIKAYTIKNIPARYKHPRCEIPPLEFDFSSTDIVKMHALAGFNQMN